MATFEEWSDFGAIQKEIPISDTSSPVDDESNQSDVFVTVLLSFLVATLFWILCYHLRIKASSKGTTVSPLRESASSTSSTSSASSTLPSSSSSLPPLSSLDTEDNNESKQPFRTFTTSQLKEFTGQNGGPIYVALAGKVYDVSRKPDVYGVVGEQYSVFAGRDASRALATMNIKETRSHIHDLEPKFLKILGDWVKKYEDDYKYPVVGVLIPDL